MGEVPAIDVSVNVQSRKLQDDVKSAAGGIGMSCRSLQWPDRPARPSTAAASVGKSAPMSDPSGAAPLRMLPAANRVVTGGDVDELVLKRFVTSVPADSRDAGAPAR